MTATGAFEPDVELWDAWSPDDVARRLAGVEAPWYVAAGWAIDLFLGGRRREHSDLEIAVPAERFDEIAAVLGDHELFVIGPEKGIARPLEEHRDLLASTHQTWVRDPETQRWRLDVFREPSDGETWICRRDEHIRMPYEQVIEHTPDGIPYGRPEIVLLYKAKHQLPKDDGDFEAVLPRLGPERRQWLRNALELVHPSHRWLEELAN